MTGWSVGVGLSDALAVPRSGAGWHPRRVPTRDGCTRPSRHREWDAPGGARMTWEVGVVRHHSSPASAFSPSAVPGCDRLWTVKEVSVFLGVPVSTLHQWRCHGNGPEAFRVGKHLRYDPSEVRRWLTEQCKSPRIV
jgi:predicted DNA-binding transcriptional regulator AlpA